VNVRVIVASNQDLAERVKKGLFREDFWYRIQLINLRLPPLRERMDDVPLLAAHFMDQAASAMNRPVKGVTPEALKKLMAYSWPGNVRELKNCAEQAVLLARDSRVHPDTIALRTSHQEGDAATAGGPAAGAGEGLSRGGQLNRARVEAVIEETNWNVARAARVLGISRDTLRYRIRKYGLSAGIRPAGAAPGAEEDEMSGGKVASAGGNGRQR
jgi:DNA-binding NtrC family response regulator